MLWAVVLFTVVYTMLTYKCCIGSLWNEAMVFFPGATPECSHWCCCCAAFFSILFIFFTTLHHLKLGCPSTSSSQPDGTFLHQELGMNARVVHGGAALHLDLTRGSDVCFLCSTCSRLPARRIRQQRERRRWHASCWCTVGPAALGKAKKISVLSSNSKRKITWLQFTRTTEECSDV